MQNTVQQLTINDLAIIRNIIELSVSRGAYRASEIRPIGEIFEKLETLIAALTAPVQNQEETLNSSASSTGHVEKGDVS